MSIHEIVESESIEKASSGKESWSNDGSTFVLDPAREKKLWRKLDRNLMPVLSVLFLLSFLDRANIGNAFAAGLIKDLNLVGLESNIASMVFYLTYSTFEVPANMLMKLIRPRFWIPSTMLAWGIVLTLFIVVKDYHGLIVARLFLGIAETGIFPGALYYISLWYPRNEQAYRVAIFFSIAVTGVAFGGILAFGISHMEGVGGLHGWAWIFGLEGMATVLFSIVAFLTIHDYPENATFLEEDERQYLIERLQNDRTHLSTRFDMRFVWQAFKDWKIYAQIGVYIGFLIPVYALALFLPTIITELGFTAGQAQLLTVPPYVIAMPLTMYTSIISDRRSLRGPFLLFWTAVGIAGFAILFSTSAPWVGYVGSVIGAIGAVSPVPASLAWAGNNCAGDMKRAVGLAIVLGGANVFGIIASFTYRMSEAPRYRTGHAIVMGFMALSFAITVFMMFSYNRLNKARDEKCKRENITESRRAEFADLGDDSPLFRYTL
ncbi:MFS general substrate transporter [Phellopilus nigrolimitatus]|nr:MFS general substrate transporter [Phellopilus nigrolimitatus]